MHTGCKESTCINIRRVLGTRSNQSNENSSESSECHFLILLDSTRSKFFFQDKISVERVESSKMSTLRYAYFCMFSNSTANKFKSYNVQFSSPPALNIISLFDKEALENIVGKIAWVWPSFSTDLGTNSWNLLRPIWRYL